MTESSDPLRMDALRLTLDYEAWLGDQIPVVAKDLDRKHHEMARHEFSFLRGTYYLWLARVAREAPEVLGRPAVPMIRDLHVLNFGTWRDVDQVRRWGVNDLDELARGSWLLDVLRLAVSAALAPHVSIPPKDASRHILDAYRTASPSAAVKLAEAPHLADLVPPFKNPAEFYKALARTPEAPVPDRVARAAHAVAPAHWMPTWHAHESGTGSLGHRRVVGVGPAVDGPHAREAKQLGPGAAAWFQTIHATPGPRPEPGLYDDVNTAIRGSRGATRVRDWQIRGLAPDVVHIDPKHLGTDETRRLLTAMVQATVDVHGADTSAQELAATDAASWTVDAFQELVHTMAAVTSRDFRVYRAALQE